MKPGCSVIIVGGGVFGIAAALELGRRGWTVTVIDPGPIPRPVAASTDISKVVRMDYGADDLYTAMGAAALDGWDRLNDAWGSPLYHQDGFLLLAKDALEPGGFERDSYDLLRRRGHAAERLSSRDVAARFPAWASGVYVDGYFNPRAGWVESGKALARLAGDASAAGVRLAPQAAFERLLERDSRGAGVVTTDGARWNADVVVVAAGAWTPSLLPELSSVMWATGQPVVHFQVDHPAAWQAPAFPVWAADISRTGWYGFPALDDGTLKIGHHATGRRVDPEAPRTILPPELAAFRAFLRESLPALADAPVVSTRLCLYCDTFDGDFWIDRDPDRPGLVVAAGDSGHGFKFAPVLGAVIADVVERRGNDWAPRFAWRARAIDGREAARAIVSQPR